MAAEDVCKVIERQICLGFPRRALRWAEDALFQKKAEEDREGEAEAWIAVAKARANLKPEEPGEAVKAAQQARSILESLENKRSRCLDVEELISRVWLTAGDYSRADRSSKLWLQQAEEIGDKELEAYALLFSGELRFALNDLTEALSLAVEAEEIFNKATNRKGQVRGMRLRIKVLIAMDKAGEATDATVEAQEIAEAHDPEQVALVLMLRAELLRAQNKHEELVTVLSQVEFLLAQSGEQPQIRSQALAMQAQAKIRITQKKKGKLKTPTMATLNAARVAVSAARRKRPVDHKALGFALQSEAKVLFMQRNVNRAMSSARESVKEFDIADDRVGEAQSLFIVAECSFEMESYQKCNDLCVEVQRVLDGIDPLTVGAAEVLIGKALDAMGPRPEDLEWLRKQEQLMLQFRGQYPELEAMMDTALEGMRAAMTEPLAELKAAPVAEAPSGGGGALRPRGSPGKALAITNLTDGSLLHKAMQEIVMNIVGDEHDDVEVDMPLMQAGLTSNTAVLFREELQNQLPGISLPPTLIFDYPSIAAISDYVIERAPVAG